MLTRVDVQSENPFYLNIRDARPTDSIIVEKIEGLNPPDVDLFISDYARDGGSYNGRRVPPRDVIFTLRYNPDYTKGESVSGLRKMLYKAFLDPFPTADNPNFILHDDVVSDRYISGYTSKFDGDLFSNDTVAQISVRCPNPYILDVSETTKLAGGPTVPFDYEGSAETGLSIVVSLTGATDILQFELNDSIMTLSYDFVAGDIVTINTVRGSRRIQVTRTTGGVTTTTDILYSMTSAPSSWLLIHSETNILKVYGEDPDTVVANITSLTFRAQHWGV